MPRSCALLSVVALCMASIAGCAGPSTQAPGAPQATEASESAVVPGLERPVRVVVDQWGVPHIYV